MGHSIEISEDFSEEITSVVNPDVEASSLREKKEPRHTILNERDLAAVPKSAGKARRFLTEVVSGKTTPDGPQGNIIYRLLRRAPTLNINETTLDDATLFMAEAAANAIKAINGKKAEGLQRVATENTFRVRVGVLKSPRNQRGGLFVSVVDPLPDEVPQQQAPAAPTDESGRGSKIMKTIATKTGYAIGEQTKSVWGTFVNKKPAREPFRVRLPRPVYHHRAKPVA